MRLAISNIAWASEEEALVADALQGLAVQYVEIAPTKVFPDPMATSTTERQRYLQFWADRGISVVAFQSLLYGRPDLSIFGDVAMRAKTIEVLSRFIELAGMLGAQRLVFGSPKNRIVPETMSATEANALAVDTFSTLGVVAANSGTCFCIEPNPRAYGCNFVTTASEGLDLVRQVAHPGFRLHLDAAGMTLAGDTVGDAVRAAGAELRHFHASAPHLGQLEDAEVDHASAAGALRGIGYDGYVSIEMRPGELGSAVLKVTDAVTLARKYYRT